MSKDEKELGERLAKRHNVSFSQYVRNLTMIDRMEEESAERMRLLDAMPEKERMKYLKECKYDPFPDLSI